MDMRKYRYIALIFFIMAIFSLNGAQRALALPDWQAVNYCNSTTAYGLVNIAGIIAENDDLVAAFAGNECRGVQNISLSQGQSYVTLVINGEFSEPVTFYLFDADTGYIYNTSFTVMTNPGGSIGYPPDFLQITFNSAGANHLPHVDLPSAILVSEPVEFLWEWGFDIYDQDADILYLEISETADIEIIVFLPEWVPVSYSAVTQVFAEISVQSQQASEGDVVAAFIDDECRGLAEVQINDGTPFVALSVAGITIQPITFHIYSYEQGMTWLSDFTINSSPGNMLGYPDLLQINGDDQILESNLQLNINEVPDYVHVLEIGITDFPPVSAVSAQIMISNNEINTPPIMDLPAVVFNEDTQFELDLLDYVIDPDNDPIELIIDNNTVLNAVLSGSILNITPPENWFGDAAINIIASDDARFYAIDTLYIQVMPVNDPPIVSFPESLAIQEDSSFILDMAEYVIDVDDDSLEITIDNSQYIEVNIASPEWIPVEYGSWATGYLTVSLTDAEISESSILAAFSGSECRGSTEISIYQNQAYAILQIFCESTTDIKFRLFDAASQTAYISSGVINVAPNSNLGFPPNYFNISFAQQFMIELYEIAPVTNWFGDDILSISVTDKSQLEIISDIIITVTNVSDPPMIDFFETIWFAANVQDWLSLSEYIYDPDFQNVTIQLASHSLLNTSIEDDVMNILPMEGSIGTQELNFSVEDEDGNISEGSAYVEIVEPYNGEIALVNGWNWISCGWGSNHYQPEYILDSMGNAADYLKGQSSFSNYQEPFGWFGSMKEIDPLELLIVHLQEDIPFTWSGWDISDSVINIQTGWNWISFLGQNDMAANDALAPLNGIAEYVKSRDGFTQYDPGVGWFGSLLVLQPGFGYIVNANADLQFTYPAAVRSEDIVISKPAFKSASAFEYNASITAVIPDYEPEQNDKLIARSGDDICGIADFDSGSIIDMRQKTGNIYYFLSIYTNSQNPLPVSLQIYNAENDRYIDITEEIQWQPDDIIGNPQNPHILTTQEETENNENNSQNIRFYPNPLLLSQIDKLTIEFPQNRETAKIDIYNIKGQKVTSLSQTNKNTSEWNLRNSEHKQVAAGIYFLKINNSNDDTLKKILILK